MDIEEFLATEWMDSAVHPFIRPPVVIWSKEPLPDFIHQEPIQFPDICNCCTGFYGFSGGYYTNHPYIPVPAPAVPEPSIVCMLFIGLTVAGIWNYFKPKTKV